MFADGIANRQIVESKFLKIIGEVTERSELSINDDFFDIGGDSMSMLECILSLQEEFAVELPADLFFDRPGLAEALGTVIDVLRNADVE